MEGARPGATIRIGVYPPVQCGERPTTLMGTPDLSLQQGAET